MTIKSFGKKLYKKNNLCSGSSEWSCGCSEWLTKMIFCEEDEGARVKKKMLQIRLGEEEEAQE